MTTTTTTTCMTSSLSEGENWIIVPPPSRGMGRSDDDNNDPLLSGPHAFVSCDRRGGDNGIVFLCVDVDDVRRVATVKDIRYSTSSSSCYSDDGVANDDDIKVAKGSEFFLARRRSCRSRPLSSGTTTGADPMRRNAGHVGLVRRERDG